MKKFLVLAIGLALMGAGCLSRPTPPVPVAPVSIPAPVSVPTTVPETSDQNMPPQAPTAPVISASTYNVSIQSFSFAPNTITVKKGDKIIFQNRDTTGHTVTSDTGAFESGTIATGASFTFDTSSLAPGSYPYHCAIHPSMIATIIVR